MGYRRSGCGRFGGIGRRFRFLGLAHVARDEYLCPIARDLQSWSGKPDYRYRGQGISGRAVRERIIRAFLVEEQKIVKKVLKIQKAKEKQAAKS